MNNFSSQSPVQFPLQFCQPSDTTFDNYVISHNAELLAALKDDKEPLIFIWGTHATGKSHLLNAIFNQFLEENLQAYFLPLQMKESLAVEMLENLEHQELLCLDDIQAIAGDEEWEHAIFHLFNRFKETGNKLVFSANGNAENIAFQLPDLKSRLQWGLTYQLAPLNDAEKITALKIRAQEKQLALSQEVAGYLIRRVSREMGVLVELLEKLDYASLSEQRKLTIPFVKQFLKL